MGADSARYSAPERSEPGHTGGEIAMTVRIQWLTEDGKRPPKMSWKEANHNPLRWWSANVIKPIHKVRLPLEGRSFYAICVVYGIAPILGGYYLMQWAMAKIEANLVKLKEQQQRDKTRETMLTNQKTALQGILSEQQRRKESNAMPDTRS